MHPGKHWVSVEARCCSCQKTEHAEARREDSHWRQQLCWVSSSPICCLLPAGEIGVVWHWGCWLQSTVSWPCSSGWTQPVAQRDFTAPAGMRSVQIGPVAVGRPLFEEAVSSLMQPPETSSCEAWFYQPWAFLLLAGIVFLLGVSLAPFPEELDLCRFCVQAGTKENFSIVCPLMKWV